MPTDEQALVGRAQEGDREAFAELVQQASPTSMRLALSILRNRQEAEDEMQNAAMKAWQNVVAFQGEARFSTWFGRIVVNQCLMRLRGNRLRDHLPLDEPAPGQDRPWREARDERETPEERLARAEVRDLVRREVRRLPPLLRKVLVRRDLEERPLEQVASELGITEMAAKSRLRRARTELQHRMRRHLGRPGAATLTA